MPRLFSYGTLQQQNVQLATFRRLLDGHPDELHGYESTLVAIDDPQLVATSGKTHHANASYSGHRDHRVTGTAFDVTEDELAAADAYERLASYERVRVALASGRQAWVYVYAATPGREA